MKKASSFEKGYKQRKKSIQMRIMVPFVKNQRHKASNSKLIRSLNVNKGNGHIYTYAVCTIRLRYV